MSGRFVKRAVAIEAIPIREIIEKSEEGELPAWVLEAADTGKIELHRDEMVGATLQVHTAEGTMAGYPNEWLIRGIQGELYPCKPDIFEATYEPFDQEHQEQAVYIFEARDASQYKAGTKSFAPDDAVHLVVAFSPEKAREAVEAGELPDFVVGTLFRGLKRFMADRMTDADAAIADSKKLYEQPMEEPDF